MLCNKHKVLLRRCAPKRESHQFWVYTIESERETVRTKETIESDVIGHAVHKRCKDNEERVQTSYNFFDPNRLCFFIYIEWQTDRIWMEWTHKYAVLLRLSCNFQSIVCYEKAIITESTGNRVSWTGPWDEFWCQFVCLMAEGKFTFFWQQFATVWFSVNRATWFFGHKNSCDSLCNYHFWGYVFRYVFWRLLHFLLFLFSSN
jgi:hypothetical protein